MGYIIFSYVTLLVHINAGQQNLSGFSSVYEVLIADYVFRAPGSYSIRSNND